MEAKRVIVIGSGIDLNGRKLGEAIDRGEFGKVVRVNKFYGDPIDVGTVTDVLFSFNTKFWRPECGKFKHFINVVMLDRGAFRYDVVRKYGIAKGKRASTGLCAVDYYVRNGYDVTVIGYGFRDSKLVTPHKTYTDGTPDNIVVIDFDYENECLKRLAEEGKITLL